MSEPQKLGDVIQELMTIFTRRREIEKRIQEGNGTAGDRIELETIEMRLQA